MGNEKIHEIEGEKWREYPYSVTGGVDGYGNLQSGFPCWPGTDNIKLLVKVKEEPMPTPRPGDVVKLDKIDIGYMLIKRFAGERWEMLRLGVIDPKWTVAFQDCIVASSSFTHIYRDGKLLWERGQTTG